MQGVSSTFSEYPIPVPLTTGTPVGGQPAARFNSLPAGERVMTLWGGTIDFIEYGTTGNLAEAQAETTILITFTPTSDANGNGAKTTTAVLAWGGHIARTADWGVGAGTISGSPYHMRIKDWTGDPSLGNLGNQDRSLKVEAVFPAGKVTIVKNTVGADETFDFSSTGSGGLPDDFSITTVDGTGSITFSQVLTGAKTVTEGDLLNGWEFQNLLCEEAGIGLGVPDNGTTTDSNSKTAFIDMDGAEHITCTFLNKATGKLTVIKEVDNRGFTGGATKEAGDFDLFVDDGFGPDLVYSGMASILTPGTYTVSEAADPNYSATFSGDCVVDPDPATASVTVGVGDDLTCTITNTCQPNAELNIVKTNNSESDYIDADGSGDLSVGDTVTYTYAVENIGNVDLTNVTVEDDRLGTVTLTAGLTDIDGDLAADDLAVGATATGTADYEVQPGDLDDDIVNIATASSDQAPDDTDTNTVPVPSPSLTTDKALLSNADEDGSLDVSAGDTLTYRITVTNNGSANLTNVTVDDNLTGTVDAACAALLAPTESCFVDVTYVVTPADVVAGEINNIGTGDSDQTPPVDDPEVVPVPSPSLTTDKALLSNADEDGSLDVSAGDTLTYRITVTNNGSANLTNVTVDDNLTGTVDAACAALLAPTESCFVDVTYVVTPADVVAGEINNIGTGDSDQTPPVDDPEVVPVPSPSLTIVKTNNSLSDFIDADSSGDVSPGDTITYTYEVENTGTANLTNVTVSDDRLGAITLTTGLTDIDGDLVADDLAAGATATGTADYVVQPGDLGGDIVNVATADSDQTDPDTDTNTVPVPNPSLTIVKTNNSLSDFIDADSSGGVSPGDTITYSYTVENTGTANLTNVTVTDDQLGVITLTTGLTDIDGDTVADDLAAGATATGTADYVVQPGDLGGDIVNIATADSDQTDPETDTNTVPVPSGGVSMTKLTNGVPDPTMVWKFTLTGPNGVDEIALTPPASFTFGSTLIPGLTYQVCESGIPAGWTADWSVGATVIPFAAAVNTSPVGPSGYSDVFDPNYVALPEEYSNDTRCVNFTVESDQTLAFEIDNVFVGGGQRTIGFWKNWNLCTNGGQAATAAANGGADAGWLILDDLLNEQVFQLGNLQLGGALSGVPNPDCEEARNILNKSDIFSGEKKASDPVFNMAAQLLAAMLNQAAEANTCDAADAAVSDGQALLAHNQVQFDGTGNYLEINNGRARQARALAETLDLYNNGFLCN